MAENLVLEKKVSIFPLKLSVMVRAYFKWTLTPSKRSIILRFSATLRGLDLLASTIGTSGRVTGNPGCPVRVNSTLEGSTTGEGPSTHSRNPPSEDLFKPEVERLATPP